MTELADGKSRVTQIRGRRRSDDVANQAIGGGLRLTIAIIEGIWGGSTATWADDEPMSM